MKIQRVFHSTVIMVAVLSLACAALAISWPEWRDDLRAEGYYGYGFLLPDTGQTKCYNETGTEIIPCPLPGDPMAQDGSYDINPMSYTDNGDGTVTDNNTGLMWQKCSVGQNNDSTCSGTALTYSWYEASGMYDATDNLTSQDVCGELTTGGYSDWRLPTKKELMSIVDYSIPWPGPTINTAYFPNALWPSYWSSTTKAGLLDSAYDVGLWDGSVLYQGKVDSSRVRCVRNGELDFGNFVDNYDGTVTDTSTGLMWQQGEPGSMTWSNALNYCEDLELPSGSGQADWRLPNVKELESITDDTRYIPAIDTSFFLNARLDGYWSSSTYAYYSDWAWWVSFYNGHIGMYHKSSTYSVRCVRGSIDYYCDDDSDGYIDWQIDGTCIGNGCVFEGCQITPGNDCNDINPLEHPSQIWYKDTDNDLYSSGDMAVQCTRPAGYKAASELTATSGDCNDNNAGIYPGAAEIKHDGIDQDCNGYDLTINIVKAKAIYSNSDKRHRLTVEATSALGRNANLYLYSGDMSKNYGLMKWNKKLNRWVKTAVALTNPGTVIVSGIEGKESAPVTLTK